MRWLSLVSIAWALSGCSLLTRFDDGTQPCDANGLCLDGYVCRDGLCVSADGGVGLDGGSGGGGGAGGGGGTTGGGLGGGSGGGGQCPSAEQACGDGLDDDCDGRADCLDPDCSGRACEDGDLCTTGETCQVSACSGGQARSCATPGPCESAVGAACAPDSGLCKYQPLADGTLCGSTTSRRCCAGACADISSEAANCGGCGLKCPDGSACEPLSLSTCSTGPANTSGRCTCGNGNLLCPSAQSCALEGRCSPASTLNCAPGQRVVLVMGCASYCAY